MASQSTNFGSTTSSRAEKILLLEASHPSEAEFRYGGRGGAGTHA